MSKYPNVSWLAAFQGDLKHATMTEEDILLQEKQGQEDIVNKSILPKNCPRTQLEKLGFVFGKEVDDLFIDVILPPGWEKRFSSHSMWSYLYDDRHRCRADIFYKAAWYDKSANLTLRRRYDYEGVYANGHVIKLIVKDCGELIHGIIPPVEGCYDCLHDVAEDWLNENYPDWEDPLAYWE